MNYELTGPAKDDLFDIWDYLADKEGLDLADRIRDTIFSEIHRLATLPEIGHRRRDLTSKDVLFHRIFNYLIIYVPESSPLLVVRVLHGARDLELMLDDKA